MKKTLFAFVALAVCAAASAQDVTVSSAVGQNIGTFINNELVGSGVYIFNAKFNGLSGNVRAMYPQIGTFQSNGFANLSMNSGVIITSGDVSVAEGPNDNGGAGSFFSNYYIDPDMATYGIATDVKGCATIDFDFVCLSNSVSFQYCFGSEEYNEYVFSQYNDAFVFLLTGPDPATGDTVTRNIAMIPGTVDSLHPYGIAVAINSVNNGTAGAYGSFPCTNCYNQYSTYFNDNDFCNSYYDTCVNHGVQYDGYTTKLVASGNILPCVKYHMHISVCDVSDNSYNSGVFLEGHSLTSPEVAIGLGREGIDTVRRSSPLTVPLSMSATQFDQATVRVRFGGQAVSGIDFFFVAADGTVINNAETITVTNAPTYFTVQPLGSADLSAPKSLDLYFASSLCPEFPDLLIYDTMHFILAEDVNHPTPGDSTGIAVADGSRALTVWPNPATGRVSISADGPISHVAIYDIDGREVYSAAAVGSRRLDLDISRLTAGLYTVRATTDGGSGTARMVVQ